MAEHFRFFDSTDPSNPDRTYNAQEFTDYFKALVTTGVMQGVHNELRVTTMGSNMQTVVDTGIAFIEGRYYENDSVLALTHDTEVLGINRIDRVVIRLDLSPENRHVKAFIKKGSPSENPIPPVLTRDETTYEISLAQVFIEGGQTYIDSSSITDERGNETICPWAGSKILPNFDSDGLQEVLDTVNRIEATAVTSDPRTQIWVDGSTGSDSSGDGTQNNPYATLEKALNSIGKVHFGTIRINVQTGVYNSPSSESLANHIGGKIEIFSEGGRSTLNNTTVISNGTSSFTFYNFLLSLGTLDGIEVIDHTGKVSLDDISIEAAELERHGTSVTVSGNGVVELTYCSLGRSEVALHAKSGGLIIDNGSTGNSWTGYKVDDGFIIRPTESLMEVATLEEINGGAIFTR